MSTHRLHLELPFRSPYDVAAATAFLSAHAGPGAETADAEARTHRRLMTVDRTTVAVGVTFPLTQPGSQPGSQPEGRILVAVDSDAPVDPEAAAAQVRRWLDLDADPRRSSRRWAMTPPWGHWCAGVPDSASSGIPTSRRRR